MAERTWRTRLFAIAGALLALWASALVAAEPMLPERIAWEKVPIGIELPVGRERLLHFPAPVKVGVPASLQPLLRAQSLEGTLYLLAHQPFAPTRVLVREVESGRTYLLDLSATDADAPRHAVHIVAADAIVSDADGRGDAMAAEAAGLVPDYGYVTLTRFAAQQLYAPSRLIPTLLGVVRVPVRRGAVPLVRGGEVAAEPLVAWRAGELYVTAVKLKNKRAAPVTLDPRALRGEWLAATFQHHRLFPEGDEADTTVLYLISARPFEASL